MKTRNRAIAFAALAALVAACDPQAAGGAGAKESRHYRAAMEDFSAGRIDAAVKGFEKALAAEPGDARARFQLACLLQDSRHDYLGAYCHYREFLFVAPDSDKAKMARERLMICERLMADELAKKMNLTGNAAVVEEDNRIREELRQIKADCDATREKLQRAQDELAKLGGENARLKKLLASMEGDGEESIRQADIVTTTKDLLDEDEPDSPGGASPLDEAKALNALADSEEAGAGSASTLLPRQDADAKAKKKAAEAEERKAKAAREAAKNAIPDTYVVQEGDTLYKIAVKFYGRSSAWKAIREANKDAISTDGRVRSGMTIKLPK